MFPQGPPRPVERSLGLLEDGERPELEAAIARLREHDAPDDVVRRVVEDVARGIGARQQSAAMLIPLAVGVGALVILSLEVQRRRGSAEGAGGAASEFFDRLIDDMRGLFQNESGEGDKPRTKQTERPDGVPPVGLEDPDAGTPPAIRDQDASGREDDGGDENDGDGRRPDPLDAAIAAAIARQLSRLTRGKARVAAQQVRQLLEELSPEEITDEDVRKAVERAAQDPELAESDPRFPVIAQRVAGAVSNLLGEAQDADSRRKAVMSLSRRVLNGLKPGVADEIFLPEVDRRIKAIIEKAKSDFDQDQAAMRRRRREGSRVNPNLPKGEGFRQDRSFITAEQFELMPEDGVIDPQRVRTTQRGFKEKFQRPIAFMGRQFSMVTELSDFLKVGLRTGRFTEEDAQAAFTDPIRVVVWNGRVFTLDHRRFIAFRRVGIKVPYKKVKFDRLERKLRERAQESQDTQGGAFILNRTLNELE